jgi:hypothetical protein
MFLNSRTCTSKGGLPEINCFSVLWHKPRPIISNKNNSFCFWFWFRLLTILSFLKFHKYFILEYNRIKNNKQL